MCIAQWERSALEATACELMDGTDGTGLKVLVPGLPVAHDGYVELYRNAACAVFQYAADKSSDDVVAKLQPLHCGLRISAPTTFSHSSTTSSPRVATAKRLETAGSLLFGVSPTISCATTSPAPNSTAESSPSRRSVR